VSKEDTTIKGKRAFNGAGSPNRWMLVTGQSKSQWRRREKKNRKKNKKQNVQPSTYQQKVPHQKRTEATKRLITRMAGRNAKKNKNQIVECQTGPPNRRAQG